MDRADVVLDCVGPRTFDASLPSIRSSGRKPVMANVVPRAPGHAPLETGEGLKSTTPLTPAPSLEPTDFELGFEAPWPSDELGPHRLGRFARIGRLRAASG